MTVVDTSDRAPQVAAADIFDVTVVLPCLNEENSVAACVAEALAACQRAGFAAEVVVVDNNSTDRSAAIAQLAGARVVAEAVPGYGAAIRAGIRAARGTVVVMADADCTYPLDRVAELVSPVLADQADIMIGSRLTAATRHSMPFLHRFLGTPMLTYLVREGSGLPVLTDSQSGFRAFRRDVIPSLGLRATGMEFASEMLIRATQHDLRIIETPLGYRTRVGESKLSTWSDGLRHLKLIVKLSPHLMLWYPGVGLVTTSLGLFCVSLANPAAISIGSATWQPVFFYSTLLMLGLGGMLAGAVVAFHSPLASRRVRATFSWIGDRAVTVRIRRAGGVLVLAGLGVDAGLYVTSLRHVNLSLPQRITLSAMAQALLLAGTLLGAFGLLYPMVSPGKEPSAPDAKDANECVS